MFTTVLKFLKLTIHLIVVFKCDQGFNPKAPYIQVGSVVAQKRDRSKINS